MPRVIRARRASRPRLEGLETRDLPATFLVTDLGDSGPGTLRDAIQKANQDATLDVISFDPDLTGTIALKTALPDITNSLAVFGPGSSRLTVAADPAADAATFRVFTVGQGAIVGLNGLTISGGEGAAYGGNIANAGTLLVFDSTVTGGTLTSVANPNAYDGPQGGGGIYNSGTLVVYQTLVSNNQAPFSQQSTPTLVTPGGGIANTGTAIVLNSTVAGNKGAFGGGLYNAPGGALAVVNSTVDGNSATDTSRAAGGGIYNSGALTVVDATVTRNVGTGIVSAKSSSSNTPATVALLGSIVAGNRASAGQTAPSTSDDLVGNFGPATAFNLIGVSPSHPGPILRNGVAGNLVGSVHKPLDPMLGALANNGGPTPTAALLAGSPARNRSVILLGLTTDQRGVTRPQGVAPDIGAFES